MVRFRVYIEVPPKYLQAAAARTRSPYFALAADLARLTFTPPQLTLERPDGPPIVREIGAEPPPESA